MNNNAYPLLGDQNFLESTMRSAIAESELSLPTDVPIGAVIAHLETGEIISRAHNEREVKKCATCHAEVTAINRACEEIGDWRLNEYAIFSTLEPCVMCAGAISQSRLSAVIYGAKDELFGATGSIYNIAVDPRLPTNAIVISGILEEEVKTKLKEFFNKLR